MPDSPKEQGMLKMPNMLQVLRCSHFLENYHSIPSHALIKKNIHLIKPVKQVDIPVSYKKLPYKKLNNLP